MADDFIPVIQTDVDPRYFKEIDAASKRADMNTPLKPTRWNNYETRTPLEVLKDPSNLVNLESPKLDAPTTRDDDFIAVSKPTEDDFIPVKSSSTLDKVKTATGGAATAVDFLAPLGTAAAGWKGLAAAGGHFLGNLDQFSLSNNNLTQEALKKGAEAVTGAPELNPSDLAIKLGIPKEYVKNPRANMPMEKLDELTRHAAEWVQDHTNSPFAALVTHVGLQTAVMIVGFKGVEGIMGKTVKSDYQRPAPHPEAVAAEELLKKTQDDLSKPLEFTRPEKEPLTMSSEYNLSKPEVKYGNEIDYYPDNPTTAMDAYKKVQEDQLWDKYNRDKERIQKEQAADDAIRAAPEEPLVEPSQGSSSVDKITKPINSRGPIGRQRGAIDMSDLFEKGDKEPERPTKYNMGDAVRLASGKQGTVVGQTESGYQIRISPKDGGGYDFVPEAGILFKSIQGGVGTKGFKQGGALDFKALFGRDNPTQSDLAFSADTIKELVYKALIKTNDLGGFTQELKLLHDSPTWNDSIVGNAPKFWANKTQLLAEAPASQFSKMSRTDQKQSADLRPYSIFEMEELPTDKKGVLKAPAASEDIGAAAGDLNTAARMSTANYDKLGGKWMKWAISNIQELSNHGTKLYKEMAEMVTGFKDLNRSQQKKLRQLSTEYDGLLNDELVSRGLQWPTRDMLAERGLTPKEIDTYISETKAVDRAWDLLNMVNTMLGREALPRIPGYFPHFWVGSWRVTLHNAEGQPFAIKPFSNGIHAKIYMREAKKNGVDARLDRPSTEVKSADMVSLLADATEKFAGKNKLGQAMINMLVKMDESAKRGIITEVLERNKNPMQGYEAERGIESGIFAFAHNDRLISSYNKYFEDVAKFWSNSNIANQVAGPFLRAVQQGHFVNMPHTKVALNNLLARAVGSPVQNMAKAQMYIREIGVGLQLKPEGISAVFNGASNYLSAALLKYNPGFWMVNYIQPVMMLPKLHEIMVDRALAGLPQGDVVKAMGTFLTEFAALETGRGSKELMAVKKWGIDNGVIEVYQADHINPTKDINITAKVDESIGEKPGRAIEERGRTVVFLALHSYFKTVMPDLQALHAAALHTDEVMGNYKGMNSPGMYTDYGTPGRMIRPFAILSNTYLGGLMNDIVMIKNQAIKAAKNPSPAELAKIALATTPIMGLYGLYYIMGGVSSMPGIKDWDAVARIFNTMFNPDEPLPLSGQYLREHGGSDVDKYGMLGSFLGVDISSSIGSPALGDMGGATAPSTLVAAAQAAYQLLQMPMGNPDYEKLKVALRSIAPTYAKYWIDKYTAPKGNPDIVSYPSSLDASVRRTEKEDLTFMLTGKHATTESEKVTKDRLYKTGNVLDQKWSTQQVSKIVTAMTLEHAGDASRLIKETLDAKRTFDADSLKEAITREMQRRLLEQHLRDLMAINNNQNLVEKANNIRQMQKLEGK